MSTTTDLSRFGARERHKLVELLRAWETEGLPPDFEYDEVIPMMNLNSGNVFLTNSEYQVAMMNGDKIETWYFCPYCGHEGFKEDIEHDPKDEDCTLFLKNLAKIREELE